MFLTKEEFLPINKLDNIVQKHLLLLVGTVTTPILLPSSAQALSASSRLIAMYVSPSTCLASRLRSQ